ncbi:MAG: hypothetical protein QOD68_1297 [Actinomycetota bacterium]|jgi:hypothetical protein|nr:hypothetical protein [Actinomycetota bacterium]
MSVQALPAADAASTRRLVLVAGVGRSGTSVFTTILTTAGFHVPQPEVVADPTNPKGFGESRWVVDFHRRQLRARRVSVWDSRPSAWADTARAAEDTATLAELTAWLKVQFVGRYAVVVKDPRVGWFLPLWERAARDIGVEVSFATMLRHPAEAVSSAVTSYGDWQSAASRTASWLNIMLETELATRGKPRVFVRYDALLADWPAELTRAGQELGVPALLHVDAAARAAIDALVDPTLHRQKVGFADLDVPASVEQLAAAAWSELLALTAPAGDGPAVWVGLDECRQAYRSFYADVESIAQSSLHALRSEGGGAPSVGRVGRSLSDGPGTAAGGGADALIRVAERFVPRTMLQRVPPVWRSRLIRAANRAGRLIRR